MGSTPIGRKTGRRRTPGRNRVRPGLELEEEDASDEQAHGDSERREGALRGCATPTCLLGHGGSEAKRAGPTGQKGRGEGAGPLGPKARERGEFSFSFTFLNFQSNF